MATRLIAGLVLVAGAALLLVATIGGDDDNVVSATAGANDAAEPDADATNADAADDSATTTSEPTTLAQAPENFGPRKDLVDLDGWLNTDIDELSDLDGKVVLVEMWTFGCHNCKARIPHTQALYASTSREDFEIVGVHAPEFSFEAEIPNIENAIVTWESHGPLRSTPRRPTFGHGRTAVAAFGPVPT